jgi:hypothetical protein
MTDSTVVPGVPGEDSEATQSSQAADVNAGFESDDPAGPTISPDSGRPDSHAADVDAGYDDESDSPVSGDDGGLGLGR